jgi:uncharacterized protein (DUF427 family)
MARAVWNEEVLAESADYKEVEGNVYFPPESVKWDFFQDGDKLYTCPWKGKAKYYDLVVKGQVNKNAAWNYPEPKPAAEYIKGYVAFGDGVKVEV